MNPKLTFLHSGILRRALRLCACASVASVCLFSTSAAFAQDLRLFLKIKGIKGDSTDVGHEGEINAIAFSSAIQNIVSTSGSGASVGRPKVSEITVTKMVDKTSPLLFVYCASGKHLANAEITVANTGGEKLTDFFKITLTDVLVSSVKTGANENTGALTEGVTLAFTKIQWKYIVYDPAGGVSTEVTGGYDLKKNVTF
ncbi:MAG: type VI secretion system tube protein Hcp [Verrucomicrobiota bacterium]